MDEMEHRHRLVQFTDTHLLADPQGVMRGVRSLPSLEACIADARRRFLPADAILVTGDLVQDEPEGYGFLELALAPLGAPVLLIPGNHDLPDELHRRLSHPPFQIGGSFALGSWVIVLLDTWFAHSANGEGRLGEERLAALDRSLEEHAARHVLVCLHHPPMPMGGAGLDALGLIDGAGVHGHHRAAPERPRRELGSRAPGLRSLSRWRALHVHAGDLHAVQAALGRDPDRRPPARAIA